MNRMYLFLCLLCFNACNSDPLLSTDTPTTGRINISVDQTFSPVIDSQVSTFQSLYKYAQITSHAVPEQQAFKDLILDSARMIVATRLLTEDEKKYFEKEKLFPKTTKIAIDAAAIILNKENTDSVFKLDVLKQIFQGKISSWNELNGKSALGNISIVFDNEGSGNVRMMKEKFNGNRALPSNCFAVKTNEEVINYVASNKNAMGIIGVNWISDGDDTATKGFLNKIKVASIFPADTSKGSGRAYQPYQAYVAQGLYPLSREVYIISREARNGLATGFSSFVAGDKGQRIILKAGLVPSTMPVRIINMKSE